MMIGPADQPAQLQLAGIATSLCSDSEPDGQLWDKLEFRGLTNFKFRSMQSVPDCMNTIAGPCQNAAELQTTCDC